jgi:hypothetical protein
MSESHKLPNPEFDWNRLQVKRFCLKMVNDFNWDYCSQQYVENFVARGWSFEKFKAIAEYDGLWNDGMLKLEKLHRLSSFQ